MNNINDRNIIITENLRQVGVVNKKSWKYCFIYIIVIITLFIIFTINYVCTKDFLNNNKIIYYDPFKVCKEQIADLNECSNKYRSQKLILEVECASYSMDLQLCFDELDKFNKRCFIYVSEFDKCRNEMKNNTNIASYCKRQIDDISSCNLNDELKINPLLYNI